MFFRRKHKLERWVDAYRADKRLIYPTAAEAHYHWLRLFMEVCDKEIVDISAEDIERFTRYIDERYDTTYERMAAVKAVSCFCRYWRSKGHKYLPALITTRIAMPFNKHAVY